MLSSEVVARAAKIRVILLDVDGVLTDGKVLIHGDGTESKTFDIKDGIALVWAQRLGLTVGILSARASASTTQRAAQLGITLVYQGVASKIDTYDQMVGDICMDDEQVCYMGDDVVDLAVLERVGLSTAPADAVDEVRSRVHWVSRRQGGDGAVRELIEMILRAQDRWDGVVASYLVAPSSVADR
ncbi:MAG TPA: HAD hydrolase family protein [Vicinamibacterales bacterium]|nr:HAD hydrolase family protein [Vicinamibacterales bacterium]